MLNNQLIITNRMKQSLRKEDLVHLFLHLLRRDGALQNYVEEFHHQRSSSSTLPNFFQKVHPNSWVSGAFMWPTDDTKWEYYRDLYITWEQIIHIAY